MSSKYSAWFLICMFTINGSFARGSTKELSGKSITAPVVAFKVSENSPQWLMVSLKIAIDAWNKRLSAKPLKLISSTQTVSHEYVEVTFKQTQSLTNNPGLTWLKGCINSAEDQHCAIELQMPKALNDKDMQKLIYLFEESSIDPIIAGHFQNLSAKDWLHKKLSVLVLIHEIGHSLGLDHIENSECLMAKAPKGSAEFCNQELVLAQERLNKNHRRKTH